MKKAISIILSVLFCLIGLEFIYISFSRVATVDFVNSAVDDINISDTINSLRKNNSQIDTAINDLYNQAENKGYNKDQVDAIINSDMSKALIESYADSILGDGDVLTNDEISEIVTNNADDIIEQSNGKLTKDDKGKIIEAGEVLAPTITENLPTKKEIQKMIGQENNKKIEDTKDVSSLIWIIVTVILVIVVIGLVLLQKKNFTSVPLLIDSIITLSIAGLLKLLNNVLVKEKDITSLVGRPVVNALGNILLIISIIGIIIFIVEIVTYFVLKKKRVTKKEAKAV